VDFLGVRVDVLLALQVLTTGLFIFIFALFTSLQEASSEQRSNTEFILLFSFILGDRETPTVAELVEAKPGAVSEYSFDLRWLNQRWEAYKASGTLPEIRHPTGKLLKENLYYTFLGPVWPMLLLFYLISESRAYRSYRIAHTDMRRDSMAKLFLGVFGSLCYVFVALQAQNFFEARWTRVLIITITVIVILGLLAAVLTMLLLVQQQTLWKSYWEDQIAKLLGDASRRKDHDQYNRALLIRRAISDEPNVPMPGAAGFYVVIFTIVQTSLVWISNHVAWL
jgi:hypothetical protein